MLPYHDQTATLSGTKSARMEQRVKPHIKEVIEQAAGILGIDAAAFVINEAYRGAEAIMARQETTRLTPQDRAMMLDLLRDPPPPTDELVALLSMPNDLDL